MKTMFKSGSTSTIISLVLFGLFLFTQVHAHDYTNLNEYQIDRANDSISENIMQLQLFLGEMFRQQYKAEQWPDTKLQMMRDSLLHQQEEAELGLEYFMAAGVNVQSPQVMLSKPLVGRTVASGQVIETAFALIKYINSLESQDAFIKEVYAGGQSSYMYNLMAAQREKMDLYLVLIALPSATGPAATDTVTAQQTPAVPLLLYLFGILGVCALATMALKPGKSDSDPE